MKHTVAILLAAALSASTLHAGVLVRDVFADSESLTQDIANHSLRVFFGRTGSNTRTDSAGQVKFDLVNTSAEAFWVHFSDDSDPVTAGGHNPVTLANDGDMLTLRMVFNLTFNATITGNQDIRLGVGDSKGTRNTADLTGGQSNAVFADDSFYGATMGIMGTSAPFRITKRIAAPSTPNNPFNNTADALRLTAAESGSTTRQLLENGVDYTFTYSIRRDNTAGGMVMRMTLSGGTLTQPYEWTATDNGSNATAPGLNTTFDWLTFRMGGNVVSQFVIKEIQAETNFGGLDPYDTWVTGFGLAPAGNGARTEDPDHDGLTNAQENLYGLDPSVPDLPAAGVITETLTGGNLVVRFTRSTTAVIPWKVEWNSNGAAPWTQAVHGQAGVIIATNPLPNNKEEVVVSIPQNGAARMFARVNAG